MNKAAEKYTSSSKHLNEDITNLGMDAFRFEILRFHRNRSIAKCHETILHIKHGIGDEYNSYNMAVGDCKFMNPVAYKEAIHGT